MLATGVNVVFWPRIRNLECRLGLIEQAFPRDTCNWVHEFSDFKDFKDGAVVVLNCADGFQHSCMTELNTQLQLMKWVLLIVIGDEGSGVPIDRIQHPNMSVYVYDAKPGKHGAFHHLPAGSISDCIPFRNSFSQEQNARSLDWFFSGSIRDIIWDECINDLPKENSQRYQYHISVKDYVRHLAMSKFVICRPSWTSPETSRVYDALEMGCIPIVGIYPGENPPGHYWWRDFGYDWVHFWECTLGENPPFPVISSPRDLGWALHNELREWTLDKNIRIQQWWFDYKIRLSERLQSEVQRLQS